MKSQSKGNLLTLFLFLGIISYGHAQSNIGHIDVQKLIIDMPEYKAAEAEINQLENLYKANLDAEKREFQILNEKYQAEAATKSKEENDKIARNIMKRELYIRKKEQVTSEELRKTQIRLQEPIIKKANDAIQKVARQRGLNYVLDSGSGQGVIFANGVDLMNDVKRELGI
ncbi:OmpH family outer membrane protein [Marinigracilibium pacificum]|uniref:OmpH family outer membrane protein n=1 Tax=Marinigracilibium pacificum TaxID=2729599 RepID=A0A848J0V3_9BACT|nr:OmpH family outer membrane protein [Marinigracilibium pacificum]NMM47919.1 OmpH family outer membrane protein [Marinigracilibium pacificum]